MGSRCEMLSEKTRAQCIRDGGHTPSIPHVGLFRDDSSFEVWADDGSPITSPCRGISISGHNCTEPLGHSGIHQYGSEIWSNNPFNYVTDISADLMRQMIKRPAFADLANNLGYTTEEFLEGVKDGARHIRQAFENELVADDPVNHPAHYTAYPGIEIIDLTKHMNFCRGNAVKYIARAGLKDPSKEIEDLEKAVFYINKEIEMLKEKSDG